MKTFKETKYSRQLELAGKLVNFKLDDDKLFVGVPQRKHIAEQILKGVTEGYVLNNKNAVIGSWNIN